MVNRRNLLIGGAGAIADAGSVWRSRRLQQRSPMAQKILTPWSALSVLADPVMDYPGQQHRLVDVRVQITLRGIDVVPTVVLRHLVSPRQGS